MRNVFKLLFVYHLLNVNVFILHISIYKLILELFLNSLKLKENCMLF